MRVAAQACGLNAFDTRLDATFGVGNAGKHAAEERHTLQGGQSPHPQGTAMVLMTVKCG